MAKDYKVIGVMSGSSIDGLDVAYVKFTEKDGEWTFEIVESICYHYCSNWVNRLKYATSINALEYQLLHTEYGRYIGERVNTFIEDNQLQGQVDLIASHGHTTFHKPSLFTTCQLGEGATISAVTGLPVVSDLRSMDVALGGQGSPISPIGEKCLFKDYLFFLNIGGTANVSYNSGKDSIAFDVCPANQLLNMFAQFEGQDYDNEGKLAASGNVDQRLLRDLNELAYYKKPTPKSLSNDFGTEIAFPLIQAHDLSPRDALRTFTEHICCQVKNAITYIANKYCQNEMKSSKLLVTGGGAWNKFLVDRLRQVLEEFKITVIVPDEKLVKFKEAVIMALIGVLRVRNETTVLSSISGAKRDSIGGAYWCS